MRNGWIFVEFIVLFNCRNRIKILLAFRGARCYSHDFRAVHDPRVVQSLIKLNNLAIKGIPGIRLLFGHHFPLQATRIELDDQHIDGFSKEDVMKVSSSQYTHNEYASISHSEVRD